MSGLVFNWAGLVLDMTGSVLNMTVFVLNITGFVLNITNFVLNMIGLVQYSTRILLNMCGSDYDNEDESNGVVDMTVWPCCCLY